MKKRNDWYKKKKRTYHWKQAITPCSNQVHRKRLFHSRRFQHIIISISSALFIGGILGMTTIKLLQQDDIDQTSTYTVSSGNAGNEQINTVDEDQQLHLETISTFVIQAGVFSDEQNALQWQKKYTNHDISTMIWQRSDKYYLFVNVFRTSEEAEQETASLNEKRLESFVKDWEVEAVDVQVTKEEAQWLREFISVWMNSLDLLNENKKIVTDKWESLYNRKVQLSEEVDSLRQSIPSTVLARKNHDLSKQRYSLLQLLYTYETSVLKN